MMADPTYQFSQHPHRKPLPYLQMQRDPSYPSSPSSTIFSHSRTRTTSSSIFPFAPQASQPANPHNMQNTYSSKRTPSTNTFSTIASSGNGPIPQRQTSTDLRRTTSSRSGASQQPTGYVALMRKQKATVWCDRAQHEDPRLLAAQRAAKMRANMEILGGAAIGRVSTSGSGSMVGGNRVAAKIRHHGKASLVGYAPATGNFGVGVGGVPMRLSASEVEGGDSDDDIDSGTGRMFRNRSGSGRSSLSSTRRALTYTRQSGSGASGRWSSGHTPPSEREGSLNDLAEETPMPGGRHGQKEYFATAGSTHSAGSASSGERADALGELGSVSDAARLASNSLLRATITREKSTKNPDELRRRGSVDERTMTMSAGRLFVANPDVDSD